MTQRILLFESPDRFVVGTVGQPGERTFFIQVREGVRITSVSLEKSQVIALVDRLGVMVREIRQGDPTIIVKRFERDTAPLESPIDEDFRVGIIGLAYDDSKQLIQIDMQAISESQGARLSEDENFTLTEDILRVLISPSVAEQFISRARTVIDAGRAPCPFCGGPIDIRGHLCPRANGYRR